MGSVLSNGAARSTADVRVLLATTLLFLVALASVGRHEIAALVPFLLYPAHLVVAGRVSAVLLLRRASFSLLFLLPLALPAPFLDTRAVPLPGVTVTAGCFSGLSLLLRGLIAVSAALALVSLLHVPALAVGLRGLGVPAVLTSQIALLIRYIALLEEEVGRTGTAARQRGLAVLPGPRLAAAILSSLFLRSIARAERVHMALKARGYRDALPQAPLGRPAPRDLAYGAAWALYFAALVALEPTRRLSAWIGP